MKTWNIMGDVMKHKLKCYIKDDRPQRLKRYVLSQDVDLNQVILKDNEGLLHFCARKGSPEMLKCLLRLECDPSQTDRLFNLPLHLAAERVLAASSTAIPELYKGMIEPLLKAYPLGLDKENSKQETGHDLVKLVKKAMKKATSTTKETPCPLMDKGEEERWKQKLSEEAQFEYEEENPYHQEMYGDDYKEAETFEDWSERLRRDYARKQQQRKPYPFERDRKRKKNFSEDERRPTSSKKSKQIEEEENLRKARKKMKKQFKAPTVKKRSETLITRKKHYEEKFCHLLNHLAGKSLTYANIPWPHVDISCVIETLFCDLPDTESAVYRKYLRTQQVRWHPDKFTQKFGGHLHADHVPKIMNRVKVISQLLNKLQMQHDASSRDK